MSGQSFDNLKVFNPIFNLEYTFDFGLRKIQEHAMPPGKRWLARWHVSKFKIRKAIILH